MEETSMQAGDLQAGNSLPETRKSKDMANVTINTKLLITTFVIILITAAGGIGGMFYFDYMDQWINTSNAHVDGRIHIVTSPIPGIVESVMVAENSSVSKDDLLIGLDSRMQELAAEQINAAIETNRLSIEGLSYGKSVILSPSDGYVANVVVKPGEFVSPGQPLKYIVNVATPWITANLAETQIRYIKVGQEVDIYIDAFPNESFAGKIVSISPAVGGTFALFPPDATAGNWVRTTQRIPVKIAFVEAIDQAIKLRIGMLARVRIER